MRVAVIADIHGNAFALEAVLNDIRAQSADAIVNLGDHFSGPVDPLETARLLRGVSAVSLLGNHDRYLMEEEREEMDTVDRIAIDALRGSDLDWLRSLQETDTFENEIFLCHGTPSSDNVHWLQTKGADKRFAPTTPEQITEDAAGIDTPLLCCGHSHVARILELADGRIVFNPGSVGRPAYTMADPASAARFSPDAGYAIATRRGGAWSVDLRQVRYDHKAAAERAKVFGMNRWAENLAQGWRR